MKILLAVVTLWSGAAFAELDPELAEVSASNFNREGLFLGGQVAFGTAFDTATSRGGSATFFAGEVGYVMPTGSWDRLEISALIGRGSRQFTAKSGAKAKQTVEDKYSAIFRMGIGYSLSTSAMAVWRIGAGLFSSDYSTESGGTKFTSSSSFTGPVGQLGADLVLQATPSLDFIIGINFNHYQFDIDKLKMGSTEVDFNQPFNVNETAAALSLRYQM